jgi:hypothetical protein
MAQFTLPLYVRNAVDVGYEGDLRVVLLRIRDQRHGTECSAQKDCWVTV